MSGQGADELRIRGLLIKQGVGPDATTPASIPPKPTTRPRDWLDDLLDNNATPAPPVEDEAPKPEPEPAAPPPAAKPKKPKVKPQRKPRKRARRHTPHTPRSAWDSEPPNPRQSLIEAWTAVPYRLKWLYCHLAAAAAGWQIGLVTWATNTAAWYAAGHWANASAWVLYVLAGLLAALYRTASKWAWPVRLLASIPIASVAAGLLLYGTGYHQ